jgi:hypothetical protein
MQQNRAAVEAACAKNGVKFVYETAPDPLADTGLAGSQQFVLEDVKRKVAEYGKDTAFYSTNIGVAEPLVKGVMESGAIYTWPSDPSPFSAFPGALGISIPADKLGDASYIEGEISRILKEKNMSGRMAIWNAPVLTMSIKGGTEYAMAYLNGEFTNRADPDQLKKAFEKVTNGKTVELRLYEEQGVTLPKPNYFFVLASYKTL